MQIPLIIRASPNLPGGRTDQIVNQYDIFPTLLELVGLQDKTIVGSPGRSFAQVLRGTEREEPGKAYFEYITARAVVTEEWKYIRRLFGEPSELYNLKADPNGKPQPGWR